ncbi:MAG: hypothetical protein ACLQU4_03010 [Limisphaerales bacterium]
MMRLRTKPLLAFVSGAIALPALLCQTAQAGGLLNETGESVLADVFGTSSGPEALVITWSVVENTSDIYTYSYDVHNPAGDVLLNSEGQPTSTPEVVDSYSVSFDTTAPGAYVPSSQVGGLINENNGIYGLFWAFVPIPAGKMGQVLSFESDLPPMPGTADASDANPPSPWSSLPDGQFVPVPDAPDPVPEPTTAALAGLTVLVLVPFCKRAGRLLL